MKDAGWLLYKFIKMANSEWLPKVCAKYMRKKRPVAIGVLFLGPWLLGGVQAATCRDNTPCPLQLDVHRTTTFNVDLKNGLLSIDARQAPWPALFKEIRGKTRMRIHYAIPLKGLATMSFTALPVEEAVERLFGPAADFVFCYPEGEPQRFAVPREVWVLGSVVGHDTLAVQTTASKTKGTLGSEANNPALVDEVLREGDSHNAETVDELIEKARNDEDAEARTQALASLAGNSQDEVAADAALVDALNDKDPGVRGYAVQALASQWGPEATEQLRSALQDSDPGVRLLAEESLNSLNRETQSISK